MLLNLREYHRPAAEAPSRAFDHALDLLARPGIRTVLLAGGDTLLASADSAIEAVVDLQGLGLDAIRIGEAPRTLCIGALVTRGALAGHEAAGSLYGGILAEAARRWAGSVQRNRATVGGAVAVATANDPLVVALLACDAQVTLLGRAGTTKIPLREFMAHRVDLLKAPAIIAELTVPWPAQPNSGALAQVARTPADAPIVVAAATVRRDGDRCSAARLALGGVAAAPLDLCDVVSALAGQSPTDALIAELAAHAAAAVLPTGDFRGSAEYRRAMAGVLSERALREAWAHAA